MEHFSNGAILKSNISQMEQFSNGAFWGRHHQLDDSLVGQLTRQRVLQDLQRALQHDGAFPQRAHKEQYHLPWVSLDKALTIKYDPLTRP